MAQGLRKTDGVWWWRSVNLISGPDGQTIPPEVLYQATKVIK